MRLDRRSFLKGLALTAAGLLLPAEVVASPERRIWQLDQTQLQARGPRLGQGARAQRLAFDEAAFGDEIVWVSGFDLTSITVLRGQGGTPPLSAWQLPLDPTCPVAVGDYLRVDGRGPHPLGISGPPTALGFRLGAAIPEYLE